MKKTMLSLSFLVLLAIAAGCQSTQKEINNSQTTSKELQKLNEKSERTDISDSSGRYQDHSQRWTHMASTVVRIVALQPSDDTLIEDKHHSSGMLLSGGQVVTTAHSLKEAKEIRVRHEGDTYSGILADSDKEKDLAIIELSDNYDFDHDSHVDFNNSPILGEKTYCLGFPVLEGVEDEGPTITSGIVGALDRSLRRSNGQMQSGLIQIDAVAKHGNSGGPAFNMKGKFVGLVGYTIATRNIWSGATFLIPAKQVENFLEKQGIKVD